MKMEEKQVLLSGRFNLIKNRRIKEWWYTGISSQKGDFYCSITFARIDLIDSLRVIVYNKNHSAPLNYEWRGFLDKEIFKDKLHLVHEDNSSRFSYTGCAEEGWKFFLKAEDWDIHFDIAPQTLPFTKYDNKFADEYSLLHFFHNNVHGSVTVNGQTTLVQDCLGYYDHCFGKVPRETKWHWIAVQNENVALDSLMNYGPFSQCYTECFIKDHADVQRTNEWIRLDQDVSFECDPDEKWDNSWHVTSPEMDVEITIIKKYDYIEKAPPIVPALMNVDHCECYVHGRGVVRVDGKWIDTGEMYGVLEEHKGYW